MSASHNCSPSFSPPPCQPRTERRPGQRPPLGVVRRMAEVPGTSSRQRWTLVLVCTAGFMLLLDITVVSVALPSIQRDLRASLRDLPAHPTPAHRRAQRPAGPETTAP